MSTIAMRFVHTNILLYRIRNDPRESAKAATASELLNHRDLCLSVQVLQEFYVQATRSSRTRPLSHVEAVGLIRQWKRFPVQEMTVPIFDAALVARQRWGISYWDAAVIEAGRALGCRELLSEDLADGQDYDGIIVTNPFH